MQTQNVKQNIPNCLRKYRKARGLKEREVAAILGLTSASILSRWEHGVCLPDTLNALRLSLLYRTLVDALFVDLARCLKRDLMKREQVMLAARAAEEECAATESHRIDKK